MADVAFQVSALLITGFKKACTQLNIADAGRALVGHTAVFDRIETVQNGTRYEIDLHW